MSGDDHALIPRTGPAPRLHQGPSTGQRSLYHQQVLDEDTYTEALSNIITRDFFPNLPHIHATNDYLTALTNNDPELLSSSIRKLAAIAQAKEGKTASSRGDDARLRELENVGTPYMNVPGGRRAPARTPVGARGWDTPIEASTRRRGDDDFDELEGGPGPSTRAAKRRAVKKIRDDLPLDAFQANYTSEDNASFVQIVDAENKQRQEERWSWAWEAEQRAEQRRLKGEEKRKMILDAATSGNWVVDGNGKRLIGGLAEGGKDRAVGEAWKDQKLITAPAQEGGEEEDEEVQGSSTGALIRSTKETTSGALVKHSGSAPQSGLVEQPVPEGHPLQRALVEAGLPATALISAEDGAIVPHREITSGEGDGRGRGEVERSRRDELEKTAMSDDRQDAISLGGSGVDQWKYKAMNNLMFPADANTKPYPPVGGLPIKTSRSGPKVIKHANTAFPDQDEPTSSRAGSSRRGTSPSRSLVAAAVAGTPYRPNDGITVNNYPLLPQDASPSPSDMPSLLTWGTLLATPRALDGGDDPLDGPSFRMPASNRRDEIGRKLGDKASRSMNERAKGFTPRPNSALRALAGKTVQRGGRGDATPGSMAPPSATPQRRENLTPAGKRLLERSLGVSGRIRGAAQERNSGWGKSSSSSSLGWTPSPGRRK